MLQYRTNSLIKRIYFSLILSILANNYLFSQNQNNTFDINFKAKENFDKVYGKDPTLYNGLLYNTFYPGKVEGDQYFTNSNYQKGEVIIRGVKYNNIDLNFDIYKQVLLLKYLSSSNVYNVIEISKAWLESFSIGNYRFVLYGTPNTPQRFYQVLGNDSLLLFYFWKKELMSQNDYVGNTSYYFALTKEQNVLINNSLKKFNSNRSFIHLFVKQQQAHIKEYLRANKINVKNASDQTMEELINYCSKISKI